MAATAEVQGAIPHRPPFLFVDSIVSVTDTKIQARRLVSPDEPHFAGHYPGYPIMPGVLLCEAVIQAGAILLSRKLGDTRAKVPVLTRLGSVKFKKTVHPGDELLLEAEITERMGDVFFLTGSASVNDRKVVTLEFACTMAGRDNP